MKRCSKCKVEKEFEEFSKKKDKLQSFCKVCTKIYFKEFYNKNRKYHLDRNKVRRKKLFNFIDSFKQKPCMDCGKSYPVYVMDFDHRDEKEKFLEVSLMGRNLYSKIKIQKEIEKCDLVCSNCHRERTHQRKT